MLDETCRNKMLKIKTAVLVVQLLIKLLLCRPFGNIYILLFSGKTQNVLILLTCFMFKSSSE